MTSFRLAKQAETDLEELAESLADRDPNWAVRILEDLLASFRLLAQNPELGPVREDLRPNLRVFPGRGAAHQYVIFYYALEGGIEVCTVVHGARDYLQLFDRGEQ